MKVYFDMDGTMNAWESGMPLSEVEKPGYMRHRIPHTNIIAAAKLLHDHGVQVYTLSAVLPFAHAIPDKDYWLDRTAPFIGRDHRIYVPCGSGKSGALKAAGIDYGDVFVDDYNVNLHEVQIGTGGIAACVKCVHKGTNDTHRSWNGARVYTDQSPEAIAMAVLNISRTMSGIRFAS